MKQLIFATSCVLLTLALANVQTTNPGGAMEQKKNDSTMTVSRPGSQTAAEGPEQNFTGTVHVEPVFTGGDPSRLTGARVTFERGARSAWHTHPLGQTLIVTSGTGWIQQEGGPKREIREGDVIWTPPGVKHWHGATTATAITHIAVQEALNGKAVEWMEKVSDVQYNAALKQD